MRIFDPKNQFGSSLLSQADTALSSKRLKKEMIEGVEAITLSSADISDIENWELCNASVVIDGKSVSFLPETSKDEYGNITVVFGQYFENVILVLKRVEFGAMCEQEQLTIEVKIRRLMGQTMAAATAPTTRTETEVQDNVQRWKELGVDAVTVEPTNYPYANCSSATELTAAGFNTGATTIGSDVCLISLDTVNNDYSGPRTFPNVQDFGADLPSLKNSSYMFKDQTNLKTFTGKIPNITTASYMFGGCTWLKSWTVALPNSLTNAYYMFYWTGLTSFSAALPNSLTNASWMFYYCTRLTSWTVALPDSITNASGMFCNCYRLTNFTASLAGLTNCENFGWMFSDCVLNEASIRNILGTLPDRTDKTEQLTIHIGGDDTMEVSVKNDLRSLAQSVSTAKNWNISLSWTRPL